MRSRLSASSPTASRSARITCEHCFEKNRGQSPASDKDRGQTPTALATAAVWTRDDLEHVPRRVFEVDAAAAVVAVDLALLLERRVGPPVEAALLHPAEDLVELRLAHQERVVLDLDLLVG